MKKKIRWGIIGTGFIARQFATGLKVLPDAEIAAVGSRSQETADRFAREFNVSRGYDSYEGLAADKNLDIVYIATPHTLHKENTLFCLKRDKAVLCEKPLTINAVEADEVIRLAREKKLFLMEAMWTRFFPLMEKFRSLIAEGVIGETKMLEADFGFRTEGGASAGRLLNPALAGGSLLDVGIYCVSFAYMVFGKPVKISGFAHLGTTGVDEQAAWIFQHRNGQLALCSSAISTETSQEAVVFGTKGRIRIHHPWWSPTMMSVTISGKTQEIKFPLTGNGLNYEAAAVMDCLRRGETEHRLMSLDESLSILQTMDFLRQKWGLRYPME